MTPPATTSATESDAILRNISLPSAVNPVIAMELIHKGVWKPEGVVGPEWFDAKPFLDLLPSYGTKWKVREEDPTGIIV